MWVSGLQTMCTNCGSQTAPTITKELWDAHDQVVVGCAACPKCGARYLFTRRLTKLEAKIEQKQGQPIRSQRR